MRGLTTLLLMVVGCRPATEGDSVDPHDPQAAVEPRVDEADAQGRGRGDRSRVTSSRAPAVSVAAIGPSDADPCEQLCGTLGECLAADGSSASRAVGLELECLDLCVHSPDDAAAKREFLSCESDSSCAELRACTGPKWTALASAKVEPVLATITMGGANDCKTSCRWIYACTGSGMPPGEAYLDPAYTIYIDSCLADCDSLADPVRMQNWTGYGECLIDNCSYDRQGACHHLIGGL